MDILLDLGANQSFLYQFIIVVLMFFLTKKLFFGHLQTILDLREERTSKSMGESDSKESEIKKMQDEYHDKLAATLKDIRSHVDTEKTKIHKEVESQYKAEEEKLSAEVQAVRKEAQEEIQKKI